MKNEKTIVVCGLLTSPPHLPDNRVGKCYKCGRKVQFRPHAPRGKKICMACFKPQSGETMTTTPRMIEDAIGYL